MRKRKGFTLVETVISLALVLLIAAIVASVIVTTLHATAKTSLAQSAIRELDNVFTCCLSDEPSAGLRLLYGDEALTEGENYTLRFDSDNKYISSASSKEATWKIECNLVGEGITLKAIKTSNGEVIREISYTKAP